MGEVLMFVSICFGFSFLEFCNCFPIDLTSVGAGQLTSIWTVLPTILTISFIVVLVVVLFGCVCCKNGKGFQEFSNSNGSLTGVGVIPNGDSFVNQPGNTELPICTPLSYNQTISSDRSIIRFEPLPEIKPPSLRPASFSYGDHEISADDWFVDPYSNFPRQKLKYVNDYGRGWFGRVVEGEAQDILTNERISKVIVKILHEDATPTDQMYFLHEVQPYRDLQHPNILKLLGRCLETEPFLILLESYPNGDLKSFLTQNLVSARALTEQGITLKMCANIAAGLQYMHEHKFIHTDLAARNCLVAPDLSIKIGDYGNCIEVFKQDYYCAGSVALPVRWCAPETLKCTDVVIETKEVTTFANVWSLGVILWEICEFCKLPYEELNDDQVIVKVLSERNYFLAKPKLFCLHKEELHHLMKLCWTAPLQRPSVAEISPILNNLVSSHNSTSKQTTQDFEQRWQALKPNSIPKTDNSPLFKGAKVGDSTIESPLGVFLSNTTNLPETPRLVLKHEDSDMESPADETFEKKKSVSLTKLNGSVENIVGSVNNKEQPDFDSWLKGVEVKNEEDERFVRNISEAIRDLDEALALEKTSSSSETSGKSSRNSPGKERIEIIPEFKLGGDTSSFMNTTPKSFELSSLQNTKEPESLFTPDFEESLIYPVIKNKEFQPSEDFSIFEKQSTDSKNSIFANVNLFPQTLESLREINLHSRTSSDTEDEAWRKRIERGEFTEKVKEKSKSIADLMVLTHIDNSDESDGDTDRYTNPQKSLTTSNFGSENNLKHAVLEEEFKESLRKLNSDHKEYGRFDSLNMILPTNAKRDLVVDFFNCDVGDKVKLLKFEPSDESSTTNVLESHFLGNAASEHKDNKNVDNEKHDSACVGIHNSSHLEQIQSTNTEKADQDTVILGPCEDHTLHFFHGLKTTYGNVQSTQNQIYLTETEAQDKDSGAEMEDKGNEEDEDKVKPNLDSIESWHQHLDNALNEQINHSNFDEVSFPSLSLGTPDEQISPVREDFLGSSFATTPLSPTKNILVETEQHSDYNKVHINKITNLNESIDDYELGKLRTPDDERSSDSGFRDKGSLSESVEDACEGKYNLEDIQAELEEAYVKGAFQNCEIIEDEKNNDSNNFEFKENKFYENENTDINDVDGEMEFWQVPDKDYYSELSDVSPEKAEGWYLHPPTEDSNNQNDFTTLDEDFLNTLRNELKDKLPLPDRHEDFEFEDVDDTKTNMNIQYINNFQAPLSPILEEPNSLSSLSENPINELTYCISSADSQENIQSPDIFDDDKDYSFDNYPKSPMRSPERELVKNLDHDTFRRYLDEMIETEGNTNLILSKNCNINDINLDNIFDTSDFIKTEDSEGTFTTAKDISSSKWKTDSDDVTFASASEIKEEDRDILEDIHIDEEDKEDQRGILNLTREVTSDYKFEEEVRSALGVEPISTSDSFMSDTDQPHSIVVFEDLETDGSKIVEETKPLDDVIVVNTITNEVTMLESPRPKSYMAFIKKKEDVYTPDSISPEPEDTVSEDMSRSNTSEDAMSNITSPDGISDYFMTPVSSHSPRQTKVEKICLGVENNEAAEIIHELESSGIFLQEQSMISSTISQDSLEKTPEREIISLKQLDEFLEHEQKYASNFIEMQLIATAKKLEELAREDDVSECSSDNKTDINIDVEKLEDQIIEVENFQFEKLEQNNENVEVDPENEKAEVFGEAEKGDIIVWEPQKFDVIEFENKEKDIVELEDLENNAGHDGTEEVSDQLDTKHLEEEEDKEKIILNSQEIEELVSEDKEKVEDEENTSHDKEDSELSKSEEPRETHEMSTSFIEEERRDSYTPDWETDSDQEDTSSSSGEFIWRLFEPPSQEDKCQTDKKAEESDTSDDESSTGSSASITDFTPSAWNSLATPTRSALKSPDKKNENQGKRNVWFKKQKYHCIYEYPREPSDDELEEPASQYQVDYSSYADWELMDGDEPDLTDTDNSDPVANTKKQNEYDFYTLNHFDYDFNSGSLPEDNEFFISSSARPFQYNSPSQFFPGSVFTPEESNPSTSTDGSNSSSPTSPSSPLSPSGLGEMRHTRNKLKLELNTNHNEDINEDKKIYKNENDINNVESQNIFV